MRLGPGRRGEGLSPRVRGNLSLPAVPVTLHRSIPASAGEPTNCKCQASWNTVYPRECGGTYSPTLPSYGDTGLSPRVRGNPFWPPIAL